MNCYIVIPIFTDSQLHPLHKDNGLSLLYVKELNKSSKILTFNHLDSLETDTYDFLKNKTILTTNKKHLLYVHPFEKVYDINLLNYYLYNKPFEIDDIHVPAIELLNDRFYDTEKLNTIIPIYKHQEYYDEVSERIEQIWEEKEIINWNSYEQYNNEAILSFYSIEKNGVMISDIFDEKYKKHLSNNKLYTNYFLYTTTGRPSNSFGGINFAALDASRRKNIIPQNDLLIEYDYDAYHVRLIADLIDYDFTEESAHDHLAKLYGVDRSEGKKLTFQYLYGGISWDIAQLNPFFGKVKDFIRLLWKSFNKNEYIETPVFKRQMFKRNFTDLTETKLFNYHIQAFETEKNIKTIIKLQRYLYKKNTELILYTYDSFLIDFSEEDGVETLKEIKQILEENEFMIKAKMGYNYNHMKDITNKL